MDEHKRYINDVVEVDESLKIVIVTEVKIGNIICNREKPKTIVRPL